MTFKKNDSKQLITIDNKTWFLFIILLNKNMNRCNTMLLLLMLLGKDL